MKNDVTIVIPTIPTRAMMCKRAILSAERQIHRPIEIQATLDENHDGAWVTRQRGAEMVKTEWMAFLDDDDELLPWHLSHLLRLADLCEADMAWGWFHVVGGGDPFPHYRGRQYRPDNPHIVPITYLIKTKLFQSGPGFQPDEAGAWDNQDQPVIDHAYANGQLVATDHVTWLWHHHGRNTSGLPTRW